MGEALVFFSLNDHVSEEHIRARDFPKWQQLNMCTSSLVQSLRELRQQARAPRHAVALGSLAKLGRQALYGGGAAGAR